MNERQDRRRFERSQILFEFSDTGKGYPGSVPFVRSRDIMLRRLSDSFAHEV